MSLFPRLLYQPASFQLGFPNGMYWREIEEWEEAKSQGVSSPCVSSISSRGFISSMDRSSWLFQLQLGDSDSWAFALSLQLRDCTNFLPLQISGVPYGLPCSFSLVHQRCNQFLILNSFCFRHLVSIFNRLDLEWYIHTHRPNFINDQIAFFSTMQYFHINQLWNFKTHHIMKVSCQYKHI